MVKTGETGVTDAVAFKPHIKAHGRQQRLQRRLAIGDDHPRLDAGQGLGAVEGIEPRAGNGIADQVGLKRRGRRVIGDTVQHAIGSALLEDGGDVAQQRALVVMTNATNGNLLYRRVVRAATGLDLLAFDV